MRVSQTAAKPPPAHAPGRQKDDGHKNQRAYVSACIFLPDFEAAKTSLCHFAKRD
jgi:hypothetical protein